MSIINRSTIVVRLQSTVQSFINVANKSSNLVLESFSREESNFLIVCFVWNTDLERRCQENTERGLRRYKSERFWKGKAVNSRTLVLGLAKIQDIYKKIFRISEWGSFWVLYWVMRWCKILQPGFPCLTSFLIFSSILIAEVRRTRAVKFYITAWLHTALPL